jgi:hypothetical protein
MICRLDYRGASYILMEQTRGVLEFVAIGLVFYLLPIINYIDRNKGEKFILEKQKKYKKNKMKMTSVLSAVLFQTLIISSLLRTLTTAPHISLPTSNCSPIMAF